MAFWNAITNITVLDPTGGSGAFIFAALNILEPLYEACLDRMDAFLAEWDENGKKAHPNYHKKFNDVLARVDAHPNRRYFVLKSIILNNLYAVDIMEEAVEICKLRLFLKLAAQVEPDATKDNLGIEPLPDIDFNIRAGNTLVGYATYEEVKRAVTSTLDFDNAMEKIAIKAADLQDAFDKFRRIQTEGDDSNGINSVPAAHKLELQKRLKALEDELNRHLAGQYSVKVSDKTAYAKWVKSHQPFHWFVQFYGILNGGGFDVIIGNPPYVAASVARKQYRVQNLATLGCPDIYAPCMERSLVLLGRRARFGMIIPISFQFGSDFDKARLVCKERLSEIWVSTFSRNPSALFTAGLGVRNTICLGFAGTASSSTIYSSKLQRWVEDFRPMLFQSVAYTPLPFALERYGWPRLDGVGIAELFDTLVSRGWRLDADCRRGPYPIRFKTTALYYISAFVKDPPSFDSSGRAIGHTKVGGIQFPSAALRDAALLVALGKISLIWWSATGDDFDVTASGLGSTPVRCSALPAKLVQYLCSAASKLQTAMANNVIYTKYAGKIMGNYDIKCVRHILDESDVELLRALNLEKYWEDIELAYAHFMKATGERPGTVRENPFE